MHLFQWLMRKKSIIALELKVYLCVECLNMTFSEIVLYNINSVLIMMRHSLFIY